MSDFNEGIVWDGRRGTHCVALVLTPEEAGLAAFAVLALDGGVDRAAQIREWADQAKAWDENTVWVGPRKVDTDETQ